MLFLSHVLAETFKTGFFNLWISMAQSQGALGANGDYGNVLLSSLKQPTLVACSFLKYSCFVLNSVNSWHYVVLHLRESQINLFKFCLLQDPEVSVQ